MNDVRDSRTFVIDKAGVAGGGEGRDGGVTDCGENSKKRKEHLIQCPCITQLLLLRLWHLSTLVSVLTSA